LKEVARRLKSDLRPYDVVGRYGGEEFLIILPGCELTIGARRADEIRNLVAKDPIVTPFGKTSTTVSMGITGTCRSRTSVGVGSPSRGRPRYVCGQEERKESRRTLFRKGPAGCCGSELAQART
jgi:hypothetical protein